MTKKSQLEKFLKNKQLCDEMYVKEQEKLKDPKYARASELSEAAWDCIASKKKYKPDKALKLITEAAQLHSDFLSHIQLMKNEIKRKEKVGR